MSENDLYSADSLSKQNTNTTTDTSPSSILSINRILILDTATFNSDLAAAALSEILHGRATSAQTATFLVALRTLALDRKPDIIAACAGALRKGASNVSLSPDLSRDLVDIVGTGGDGHDTFNVSTTAAIVAAGAGCKVAKHGNRAASSLTGSADILEAVGCKIDHFTSEAITPTLAEGNFCFLFAARYHPLLRSVAAIRKEIGLPTIFNILGPLLNPSKPSRLIVGVHSPELGPIMAEALKLSGVERAMVVCGAEGLDEISPAGDTHVWNLQSNGSIQYSNIHPRDFGLPTRALSSVRGGHPRRNASLLREILNSNGTSFFNPQASDIEPSGASAEEKSATLDFVLMNAAALIIVAGKTDRFTEAMQMARESLSSGMARKALEVYASATLQGYANSVKA